MKMITAENIRHEKRDFPLDAFKWRPATYGILIENGKILLIPDKKGCYDLPGGGIQIDENIESATIREFKEETGLQATFERILETHESYFFDEDDAYHSILFYCLLGNAVGDISTHGFDEWEVENVQKAEWVSVDELKNIEPSGTFDWRVVVMNYLEKEAK
jgi:ADP-ribose pyrophosphatase YjhB (NUDIX family)